MKTKMVAALCCISLSLCSFAQEEMKIEWTKKYDHKTNWVGTGLEGPNEVSYIATDKMITVYKTADGSIVWSKPYKELAPRLRKINAFAPFWKSDALFMFDYKTGKDQLAVVDLNKGNVLWESTKYQGLSESNIVYIPERKGFILSLSESIVFVDARSGEEKWETSKFKGSIADYTFKDGDVVMFNVTPPGLKGLFKGFKNQIVRLNLDNGDIKWENTFVGVPERKVITREQLYDISVLGDKIFLELNGLQVYDYNTGATLWKAAYEETPKVIGAPANATRFGVYGAVAKPVRVDRDVYVLEFNKKRDQTIKKYDANTGKLLWTSPEIKGAKAIPNLFVIDDKVVAQIGGVVEVQQQVRTKNPDGTITITTSVFNENIKPNGLQAFNTKDGSLDWVSEKFKKGITNAFVHNKNLIVSSGKSLYSIQYATGDVNFEKEVKNAGVGNAVEIRKYKDKIVVVGLKGVSTFSISDGKLIHANKYKKAVAESQVDNILLMRTPKNDFAAFNLDDCSYVMYNAKKDSQQTLSQDGKFVWAYEKKQVTKLKTR